MNNRYKVKSDNPTTTEKQPAAAASDNDTWFYFCCQQRRQWWSITASVLLMLFCVGALIALILASLSIWYFGLLTQQTIVTQSGTLSSDMMNVYITTNVPVVLHLPKDLSSYAGRVFHVDCAFPGHTFVILPGGATWNLSAVTATCAAANSGFSFKVVTKDKLRIISQTGVTFT
ncbi:MAG: hypothetical protein K2Q45_06865 [Nitrosomonas sp.]|nr:hypothetical protein [Nitrosomonas sp.]